MALIPYQPQNLVAEQADGNILLTWTGSLGATTYQIQRSLDGVNFTNLATTTTNLYIDAYPGIGIKFYYQVAGVSIAGTSVYSSITYAIAAPPGEMSLGELRLRSQQACDRVESDFVVTSEWNAFIRLAMYELYDLMITVYEDYFTAPYVYINTNAALTQQIYPLPDGASNYIGNNFPNASSGTPAPRFYKLVGVDLGVNTSNNAWVTINRYDYIDRNAYVYPNSTSTIYGIYNMRYRVMGNSDIRFIPTPAGNQQVRLTYAPILPALLADTDLTTIGMSGWLRYVIARSAKYALDKEEGMDTSKFDAELLFLKARIEQSASNRDIGQPDTISETRKDSVYGGTGWGQGGGQGGWMIAPLLFPQFISYNQTNSFSCHSILQGQFFYAFLFSIITISYLSYRYPIEFGSRISFAGMRYFFSSNNYFSTLRNHIRNIFKRGSKK